MPFTIVRQDITKMQVDAIVNAANTDLLMGGGVCGAIFAAAGADELQQACDPLAPIATGQAVITPGFALPAKHIIHTAGPVYCKREAAKSEAQLRSAYLESLRLAKENHCQSIAFPLISSGIYGYPKDQALLVATSAIQAFLAEEEMEVYLAIFDKAAFAASQELMGQVASYIDEHYVQAQQKEKRELLPVELESLAAVKEDSALLPDLIGQTESLAQRMEHLAAPFNVTLLRLIDAKGMTDVAVYKRANLDRKLFSKIRTGKGYLPSKRTAIALAIALELSLAETENLLACAGYALSHSQRFDVIIEFFILHGKYNIFEINEVLFQYNQPLLGAS